MGVIVAIVPPPRCCPPSGPPGGKPRGGGPAGRFTATRQGARGFSFIELIVVMGVLAMLMGLTVGYIRSAGRVSGLQLARNQIMDSGYRAQQMSRGERLTVITFREADDSPEGRRGYEIFTMIAEGVLSHAFESVDGASRSLPLKSAGSVKIVPGGNPGNCGQFSRGGPLEFEPQASFAMTDGLDVEMWLMPEAGSNVMTLLDGQGAYEISLVRGVAGGDYDVRLRVNLRPPDGQGEPGWSSFETERGPVRATGRWTHVHVRYNGMDASLEVDGLEHAKRGAASSPARGGGARRLAVPREGAVALTVSSSSQPYVGKLDGLIVRGVFRLKDDRTLLPDGISIDVLQPAKQPLPFRLHYVNGRLDPVRHAEDVRIAFRDVTRPDDPPLVFSAGRHGALRADFARGSATVEAPPVPGAPPVGPEPGRPQ